MRDIAQMDIKKYGQILVSRRYVFIGVSILCLSVIVWGSFFMPKIYEAQSTVFIERNIIKDLVKGIVVTPSIEERLRVLTYAMMSRNMLLKVIETLDLDIKAKNQAETESMIKDFQNNTKITVKGNDLFVVSYRGKDPKMVRDYVNSLISRYIEENTSSKREEAFGANQFLSEQIDYYKKKLEDAEDVLVKFRLEKGIYFSTDEKTMVTSIQEYRKSLEETQMKIKELEAKKQNLQGTLSGKRPLPKVMLSSEKNILKQRLSQLEQYLPLLLTKNTENHPEVIKTKAEIKTTKKQLEILNQSPDENTNTDDIGTVISTTDPVYQQLQEELLQTESEIDSLKAKVATLNTHANRVEAELRNIPEEKKKLAALERDRNTYQGIYNQLLNRLGQAEVSKQMEIEDKGTNFRVVDLAILPTRPVSPDRIKFILFGIVVGITTGIGAVFMLEYLDSSIKDVDTLKTYLGVSVLAVVPKIVTAQDIAKNKKTDGAVYAVSIAYLSVIGFVFIRELMNRFF